MLSQMPTTKIESTRERRRGARQHGADRPPRQHRHLRAEQLADDVAQPDHLGLDARIALHQRDVAKRVGGALGQIAIVALDRALPGFGLAQHQRGEPCEHHAEHDQQQRQPPVQKERQRQQHQQRNERRQMLAEKSKPQPPQRIRAGEHDLHQPAGMDAAVEAERQLQDVLEVVGHHRVTAAVRQPVGVQRHQRAAGDGEQAEAHPGREQRYEIGPDRNTAASSGRRPVYRRCARTGRVRQIAPRPAKRWRWPASSRASTRCPGA